MAGTPAKANRGPRAEWVSRSVQPDDGVYTGVAKLPRRGWGVPRTRTRAGEAAVTPPALQAV